MNQGYRQGGGNHYAGSGSRAGSYPPAQPARPAKPHVVLSEENYVDLADNAIKSLIEASREQNRGQVKIVTTSKIRNLLAMTADIYNEAVNLMSDTLPKDLIGRISYLKVRFIYEAGREPKVKDFVNVSDITNHIEDIKTSRKQFILFSRYMESLVAFRKYYVSSDE